MTRLVSDRVKTERGFSLVEAVMGMMMLSFVLLGLAAASGHALRQASLSQMDVGEWATLQAKLDSLVALGAGSITDGSDTINGQALAWQVNAGSPQSLLVVFDRMQSNLRGAQADTLVLYLSSGD